MLLGHARGKVGDLVFSRSNGQQVIRARAAVVKNPQTEKQMIQRIILNTVSQAYSRMSAITDHSFEGVQQGQKSMSFFMRKNLDMMRTRISEEVASGGELANVREFAPIGTNYFVPNAYIVASGSLPTVDVTRVSGTIKSIAISGNTYGDVIASLNLQRGDQLTFVCLGGNTIDKQSFAYARVILDPRNENDEALPLTTTFAADGAVVSPNPRNEGSFTTLSFAESALSFGLLPASQIMLGVGVIVSRQTSDGSWKRSNTQLATFEQDVLLNGYSMQDCLDIFAAGGFDTENYLYLNNAGKSNTAAAATGGASAYKLVGAYVGIWNESNYAITNGSVVGKGNTVSYSASTYGTDGVVKLSSSFTISPALDTAKYDNVVLGVMGANDQLSILGMVSRNGHSEPSSGLSASFGVGSYQLALYGRKDSAVVELERWATINVTA